MPSKLQLINRVLSDLGKLSVSAISDSDASQQISNKIDELYPEILLACNWTWAIVYKEDDSPVATDFSPDYVYTYQLPGDFGQFYKWGTTGSQWPIYEFVDGYLLAQTNPVQYYYIKADANYSVWPALMARALVLYVGSELSATLTQNLQLTVYLTKKYEKKLTEAIIQNYWQNPVSAAPYNDFNRINLV